MEKSIICQWKYNSDSNIELTSNQNVDIIQLNNGYKIMSKQNKSTPGALLLHVEVEEYKLYKVSVIGKTSAKAFIFVCGSKGYILYYIYHIHIIYIYIYTHINIYIYIYNII